MFAFFNKILQFLNKILQFLNKIFHIKRNFKDKSLHLKEIPKCGQNLSFWRKFVNVNKIRHFEQNLVLTRI